ncbi:MAG: DUF5671 domain-containing protein [Candidatus Promineifilaceae bacterium]
MSAIRNWYIYLVAVITASIMTWAATSLLRDLTVVSSSPPLAIASKVAALIVAVPIFVIHIRWAQRILEVEPSDRFGLVSRLYLSGMMATYLGIALTYAYHTLSALLYWLYGARDVTVWTGYSEPDLTHGSAIVYYLVPTMVAVVIWLLHRQLIVQMMSSRKHITDSTDNDVVLRLPPNVFAAVGLGAFTVGLVELLKILLRLMVTSSNEFGLTELAVLPEVARIIISLPLWIYFQRSLQQKTTAQPEPSPQLWAWTKMLSTLALFIAVFISLGSLLWSTLEILLNLAQDNVYLDMLPPATTLVVCAVLGVYYKTLWRASLWTDASRFYHYVIAGIGLSTFLSGTAGLITMLIRELTGAAVSRMHSLGVVAWAVALIAIGLPAWLWSWLKLQRAAMPEGDDEDVRTLRVRQIYLYFFLFVGVTVILGSAIYILTQLVGALLGEPLTRVSAEMAQSIAYILLAALVLSYHWRIVTADRQFMLAKQTEQEQALLIVVVDDAAQKLGDTFISLLRQQLPKAKIETPDLDDEASAEMLAAADFIVAPSSLAPVLGDSPTQKLFIPAWSQTVNWVGAKQLDTEEQAKEVANGVRHLVAGKPMRETGRFGCWSLIGIVVVLWVLLQLIGAIAGLTNAF